MSKWKQRYYFGERLQMSQNIINKYPNSIPIICERGKNSGVLPILTKIKYLVPDDYTVGQFMFFIRKSMILNEGMGIFFFIDGEIPPTFESIGNIYTRNKDPDGFLYITYVNENVFG